MRGERVAQRMGRDVLLDPRPRDVLLKDLPGSHAGERLASGVEEQDAAPCTLLEARTEFASVRGERADGATADGHQSFLAPLAEYAHEPLIEHEISHTDRNPFRDAKPRSVRQLQH